MPLLQGAAHLEVFEEQDALNIGTENHVHRSHQLVELG
jgi:hypothetical protein